VKIPCDLNGLELAHKLLIPRLGPAGQQHLTIPAHRPLRVGTLRAILKSVCEQCEVELPELLILLEL